jgi:hypothetical protein
VTPTEFVSSVLDPGIAWCQAVPGWHIPFDDRARVLMLAIAGQESNWTDRVQGGNGPAHSYWQQERMGGIHGVLHHPDTAVLAKAACVKANVPADEVHVWGLFATAAGDDLATAFARLLLWTDHMALSAVGAEEAAYQYYLRNWRPGKPSRTRWSGVYPQSMAAIKGQKP